MRGKIRLSMFVIPWKSGQFRRSVSSLRSTVCQQIQDEAVPCLICFARRTGELFPVQLTMKSVFLPEYGQEVGSPQSAVTRQIKNRRRLRLSTSLKLRRPKKAKEIQGAALSRLSHSSHFLSPSLTFSPDPGLSE